ncbi:maleylpyruvate isomerase family mycothiol-dependent enzyme [Planomonospora venezuelensis]|uniref:Maleylpyruvate isomerase n=1 Tax=Planomonospora venezuelensis TaxID=1999 RepID=A0A841D192_PLAVE|nr:maleylpyruvate isomerase family mycothiol-dependent enzyme [Planomonospora venezuelensis]MBB5963490.1 maleylpyruvate isomerase [Planomonospora venezuelensis]GIN05588.1 maleylpyruvate isomerase [Planomonospora venezuelensis]
MDVLNALQSELAASTGRLLSTVAGLSDADLAEPSRLPGWTRGHLITHVARNADSLVNLVDWARTGVETPQYPSVAARDADIAAGASRPVKEQLADLEESSARLAAAFRDMPAAAWSAMVSGMQPPPHPAWYLLVRRVRETEIHHVDLGAGYDCSDWPEPFVRRELHDAMVSWSRELSTVSEIVVEEVKDGDKHRQVWRDLGSGPVVQGDARTLLAWVTGRSAGAGLRVMREGDTGNRPAAGPLPSPPPWSALPTASSLPATPPEEYP